MQVGLILDISGKQRMGAGITDFHAFKAAFPFFIKAPFQGDHCFTFHVVLNKYVTKVGQALRKKITPGSDLKE